MSRADIDQNGKRPDIVRSPETFVGVVNLVNELSNGCHDIYKYMSENTIKSIFAKTHMQEEFLKAKIITMYPEQKALIFKLEDNDLMRGHISFAFDCAGVNCNNLINANYDLLRSISEVFTKYFYGEKALNNNLRRAMLTIENNGKYEFYKYWWSYWGIGQANKRKLFDNFREIEYFMGCEDKVYLKKLVLLLTENTLEEIIENFEPPTEMPHWQVRLIKEGDLLDKNCHSNHIAIPADNSCCYLLKSKRPRCVDGNYKVI